MGDETVSRYAGIRWLCLAMTVSLAFSPALRSEEYPPDLDRGKAVYEYHCLACHGTKGRGDGPTAASLTIVPTNFQRSASILKSDEALLRTIEHGVVFSPMHSWRGRLTDGEMQDVVAYIRVLSQETR